MNVPLLPAIGRKFEKKANMKWMTLLILFLLYEFSESKCALRKDRCICNEDAIVEESTTEVINEICSFNATIDCLGLQGSQILTGEGTPNEDDCNEETFSDIYIDTLSNNVSQCIDGMWIFQTNIQGEQGETGSCTCDEESIVNNTRVDVINELCPADSDLDCPGLEGSQIITGEGPPNDTTCDDETESDIYIDITSNNVSQCREGEWVFQTNIQGEEGPPGPEGSCTCDEIEIIDEAIDQICNTTIEGCPQLRYG